MACPRGRIVNLLALFGFMSVIINFPEGYTNSYPNTSHKSFVTFINQSIGHRGRSLSFSTFTWIWSAILNVWFVGYLIGTFLTPTLTEELGRKKSLLLASGISVVGALFNLLSILFEVPELFFTGRAVSSIGSGISFGALILFLQEVAPTAYRGISSFMCETAFLFTTLLGIFCGMDIALGQQLLYLTGLPIIPALISLIVLIPLKETPKHLLLKSKHKEAARRSVLFYQGGDTDVDMVLSEILKEGSQTIPSSSTFQDMVIIFRERHLRTAFFVGILTMQLIVSFWPITYLSTSFLESIFPVNIAQFASLLFILSNFVAAILGLVIIQRFGRRPLVLWLGLANTISLGLYIFFDRLAYIYSTAKEGCIIAFIIFGISYGIGLGPIAFFITSELVTQQYRSLLQSIVFALNTIMTLIFSSATLPLYTAIGVWVFIPLFIIPNILSLIYLYYKMPETKGREIHQVVDELLGKCMRNKIDDTQRESINLRTI